jgi:hypothetical protein
MPYDPEDIKRMLESEGWKIYCAEIEKLIHAQLALVEVKVSHEDFLAIKHKVIAYKTALDYPHVLIERESASPA